MAGVDEYGEWVPSAMGSNANENVDVEELGCKARVGRTLLGTRHQVRIARREQIASVRVGDWMPTREHQYVQVEMERAESRG
jgi:hypothetical protein